MGEVEVAGDDVGFGMGVREVFAVEVAEAKLDDLVGGVGDVGAKDGRFGGEIGTAGGPGGEGEFDVIRVDEVVFDGVDGVAEFGEEGIPVDVLVADIAEWSEVDPGPVEVDIGEEAGGDLDVVDEVLILVGGEIGGSGAGTGGGVGARGEAARISAAGVGVAGVAIHVFVRKILGEAAADDGFEREVVHASGLGGGGGVDELAVTDDEEGAADGVGEGAGGAGAG